MARRTLLTLLFASLASCAGGERASTIDPTETPAAPSASDPGSDAAVVLTRGPGLAPAVSEEIEAHLRAVVGSRLRVIDERSAADGLSPGSLVIGLGDTRATRDVLAPASDADPEAFTSTVAQRGGVTYAVVTGSPHAVGFGAYALLEDLGFAFLHPLAPVRPRALSTLAPRPPRREAPRWRFRGLQLHTMHPLELTNVLQGWGPLGPEDAAGWEAMLPEWDRFLEWLVANRQNRVHWVLLEAASWEAFASSDTRLARLTRLVDRAHAHGVTVGIDVPIAQEQQHTFRLVKRRGTLAEETAQITARLDWLMRAGFDYVATENGTTEFTHAEPTRMVDWMNAVTRHLGDRHGGRRAYVKIHCSTGQEARDVLDPDTGRPINVNHLPKLADARLGVMPHTVQHYGLDDPAPTYGNQGFSYVRDFIRSEGGRREVIWHPETAYWVSFDVDVPLFLPVYAERRVHDLRLIARDEEDRRIGRGARAGARIDGQSTFSSGWEWGYWLNDVVTARASWDPRLDAANDDEATRRTLEGALRVFGDATRDIAELVVETARVERELLIHGRVRGAGPADVEKRNGQAYLQGFETWDDVSALASSLPGTGAAQMTQPARLGLVEMRTPLRPPPRYTGEVEPLLAALSSELVALSARWDALAPRVAPEARDLFDDMRDAMRVTALRARQVHGLYDYVDLRSEPSRALPRLADARAALDDAARVVSAREPRYRVPADRIAGWGRNPTAYNFGYLWSVRRLYYWWRDEGKAVDAPRSPCYLNVLSMADIAMGEGPTHTGTELLQRVLSDPTSGATRADCLGVPDREPVFPLFGLRQRP